MLKAKDARNDRIIGVVVCLFAIGFYAETQNFSLIKQSNTVDATFFPRILAVLSAAFGIAIFIRGQIRYCKLKREGAVTETEKQISQNPRGTLRVTVCALVMLVAALLIKSLGFLLTMPWMMFALFLLVERKDKYKIWLYAIFSIVGPIVLYFVFYYLFSSLLPMGILKPFLSKYFL